jgi:hypothetical protein
MRLMSMRTELDGLAMACEECAGNDASSIDDHLESCPVCKEHAAKADEIDRLLQDTKDLASKPEQDRRMVIAMRLADIKDMPEANRVSAITDLTDAIGELSEEERDRIVRTRTDLLTTLPKAEREVILSSFKQVVAQWDDNRKQAELRSIMSATDDYPLLKRRVVRRIFNDLLA